MDESSSKQTKGNKADNIQEKSSIERPQCRGNTENVCQSFGREEAKANGDEHQEMQASKETTATSKENTDDKNSEMLASILLARVCIAQSHYDEAIVHGKKGLVIAEKTGDKNSEMAACAALSHSHNMLKQFDDAISFSKRCLVIADKTGDKFHEMKSCEYLSCANYLINQYDDALVYGKRCLEIAKEVGDKTVENLVCIVLCTVCHIKKQYHDVVIYAKRGLEIAEERRDVSKSDMQLCCTLAIAHQALGQYHDAITYSKRWLEMAENTGDKEIEFNAYDVLTDVFASLHQYDDAIKCETRRLEIAEDSDDKPLVIATCVNLADLYMLNYAYYDAIEFAKRALKMSKEMGDRNEEMRQKVYLGLASSYYFLNQFGDVILHCKKWLEKPIETSVKMTILQVLFMLSSALYSEGVYEEAIVYGTRMLEMAKKMGDKHVELHALSILFHNNANLGQYESAFFFLESAVKMGIEDFTWEWERSFKMHFFNTLRCDIKEDSEIKQYRSDVEKLLQLRKRSILCRRESQFDKSITCLQQIIALDVGVLQNIKNAFCHEEIARNYERLNESEKACEHYQLAVTCSSKCSSLQHLVSLHALGAHYLRVGDTDRSIAVLKESALCKKETFDKTLSVKYLQGISSFPRSTCYRERGHEIFIFDNFALYHKLLAEAFLKKGKMKEALMELEHHRGEMLLKQLVDKYGMEERHFHENNKLPFHEIQSFLSGRSMSILFYFVTQNALYRFLIEEKGDVEVYSISIRDCKSVITAHLREYVFKTNATSIRECENRSLDYLLRGNRPGCPSEGDDDSSPQPNDVTIIESEAQSLFCLLFDGLSVDKLKENLAIIPDGPLFEVPFAALKSSDTGKQYLSETKCIRIFPSIRTLMLSEESTATPVEAYSDALIIGNPNVGTVMFNGKETKVEGLTNAQKEAEEIAQMLDVEALTNQYANKPAVLRKLQLKPKLVHIAAHGYLERSAIGLAPSYDALRRRKFPLELDYMLTMQDVERANVQTQLAVLGCCHSGCGETLVEGVIGMCRAFLVSGAHSVLSSLWAIDDAATLAFMKIFYRNLKEKKSTGTSLKLTMKEMRESGQYRNPKYWAPFFLMGKDATIDV